MDKLKESLKILSLKVINEIFKDLKENNLPKLRYRVYDNGRYDYTDRRGIKQCQCYWDSTKRIYKFDILNVTHRMFDLLKSEEIYEITKNQLYFFIKNNNVAKQDILVYTSNALYNFVNKLNKCVLSEIEFTDGTNVNNLNLKFDEIDIERLINGFIEELKGKPANVKVEIELSGMVLNFNKVVMGILELRRPNQSDLRKLYLRDPHLEYPSIAEIPTCPSAILSITYPETTTDYDTHFNVTGFAQIIVRFLSLFKIGDIKCLNFKIETDSILKSDTYSMYFNVNNLLNHINSTLDLYFPIYISDGPYQKKYTLSLPLAHHLDDFIVKLGKNIYNLYSENDYLHINIAYGHYLNALTQNDSIMETYHREKRITEAIMGLESLYSNEKAELPYRVKIRISKVFDTLMKSEPKKFRELLENNYNPIKVKTRINEAYRIRNALAHGDRPKTKTYKKIKKNLTEIDSGYNGLDDLLTHLIDYLRISIILSLFNEEKNKFIDTIDNSLISCKSEELDKAFSKTKNLILLNNIDLTIGQTISWIQAKSL